MGWLLHAEYAISKHCAKYPLLQSPPLALKAFSAAYDVGVDGYLTKPIDMRSHASAHRSPYLTRRFR